MNGDIILLLYRLHEPNLWIRFQIEIWLGFSPSNISNGLEVFCKLRPTRKYKYKEYITTIVDVMFLTIFNNIQVRINC